MNSGFRRHFKQWYACCILLIVLSVELAAQPLPALIPYRTKAGYGYADSNKVMRVKPQFDDAETLRNGRARASIFEGGYPSYSIIDESGRFIIPPSWHWTGTGSTRLVDARLNAHDDSGHWGIIDPDGRTLLPFLYQDSLLPGNATTTYFQQMPGMDGPFMIARRGDRTGVIDTLNRTLIPFEYSRVSISQMPGVDSLHGWTVCKDSLCGVLKPDGKPLFPLRYEAIYPTSRNGWATARMHGRMGAVDTAGRVIIPFRYDSVGQPGATGFPIRMGEKWGWYDVVARREMAPQFDCCPYAIGRYLVVRVYGRGRQQVIDWRGKVIVPPIYKGIWAFNGVLTVYADKKLAGDEYESEYASRLDTITWKPVGGWSKSGIGVVPSPPQVFQQVIRGDELYMESSEGAISSFTKEGFNWKVASYIRAKETDQYRYRNAYGVMAESEKGKWYAVVDKDLNFIVRPQQRFEIIGGELWRNWLIVRDEGLYGITDTNLNIIVKPIRRKISYYYPWRSKHYLLGAWQAGQAETPRRSVDRDCFRCNCLTLLDRHGEIVRGFENYCAHRNFGTTSNELYPPEEGILKVDDSLWRTGMLTVDGALRYPAVSFKYSNLRFYTMDIVGGTIGRDWWVSVIVDAENRSYFPQSRSYRIGDEHNGLFRILFREKNIMGRTEPYFFMDYRGVIYADPDAIE